MQVETVLVVALLIVEEELAEFARAEGRSNHPVVQHKLVDRQDGDCTLPSRVKSEVRGVRGAATCSVVHVFRVHDHLL